MLCRWTRSLPFQGAARCAASSPPPSGPHTKNTPCATPSPDCLDRRSAKWPTPPWAAATCWPSGSARATRSRPSRCARRRPQSLHDGETFYCAQPRPARAARRRSPTTAARCTAPVDVERIAVTSSGVNALMLAMQLLAGAGDEVVAVVPLWPNLTAQPAIMGARVRRIALRPAQGRWTLDLDALRAAVTPAHPRAADQRAEQPHRLDADARRAAGHPGALPRAPAPGSSPTRSTSASTSAPARRAPSFLDIAERRRPAGGGAQLLQELPDDRLAPGLAGAAARPPRRHRQADRVQHLLRAGVRAARRPGGAADGAGLRAGAGRSACATAATGWSRSWRRCPAWRWPARRAACTPSSACAGQDDSLAFAKRLVERARPGPGAGRGLRRRRARAGCAGALRRATRSGWTPGCSAWPRALAPIIRRSFRARGEATARYGSVSPVFASRNGNRRSAARFAVVAWAGGFPNTRKSHDHGARASRRNHQGQRAQRRGHRFARSAGGACSPPASTN